MMKKGFTAFKNGNWEECKHTFRKMKASEWAFDRIKVAFGLVAQDEAEKVSIVQEIMLRSTDLAANHRASWTMSYLCPHCNSFLLEDFVWWVSGGKHTRWWYAICGEKYDWKQPNKVSVVQTAESIEQAKVFKAHAVPQGLCTNLVNALQLLANQQEDGDGFLQNIVNDLGKESRKGLTDG